MLLVLNCTIAGDINGLFSSEASTIPQFVHELPLLPHQALVGCRGVVPLAVDAAEDLRSAVLLGVRFSANWAPDFGTTLLSLVAVSAASSALHGVRNL